MKKILPLLALILFFACSKQENDYPDYPISMVNLNYVELTDNFWLPRIQKMQESNIIYAFKKCEEEGRFENFITAGKVMKGESGKTRGLMPFDDTDVYKTLEGASYSLISAPNKRLDNYLDSIISIIKVGQEPDGYITTWRTINPQKPPCSWVKPGERWEDLGSSHELYNSGHLFEAAAAHYYATGKRNLLNIALKNADLLVDVFLDATNHEVPGHQVVETGLVQLYRITGKEDYLALSKKFLDLKGDSKIRQIRGPYSQDHLLVIQQDEVVGHAVRAVYMYAGMTDIAAIYKDVDYVNAVNKLWSNMVEKKMYITGGLGALHDGEAFGANYELPNLTAYSETCAAIGGVYWNERLFNLTGDAKYYDVLERMLYNALISGISLEGTEFFYPCPLESDANYRFNKGFCTRNAWFDCSCCPTNLMRFIPYVPNLVYATDQDDIYVNLFMANKASIPFGKKNEVNIEQKTDYPWDGKVSLAVKPKKEEEFTLKIRIPGWTRNEVTPGSLYTYTNPSKKTFRVFLDGEEIKPQLKNGYVEIARNWTGESKIELEFPMDVKQVTAREEVGELIGLKAIEYGPFVYCCEEIDNPDFDKIGISSDDQYIVEKKSDLLGGINVIRKVSSAPEIVFIPYYAWSNRGVNKMKVWLTEI